MGICVDLDLKYTQELTNQQSYSQAIEAAARYVFAQQHLYSLPTHTHTLVLICRLVSREDNGWRIQCNILRFARDISKWVQITVATSIAINNKFRQLLTRESIVWIYMCVNIFWFAHLTQRCFSQVPIMSHWLSIYALRLP